MQNSPTRFASQDDLDKLAERFEGFGGEIEDWTADIAARLERLGVCPECAGLVDTANAEFHRAWHLTIAESFLTIVDALDPDKGWNADHDGFEDD